MAGKPTKRDLEQRVKELEKEVAKLRRAEEDLRESENRFRIFTEHSPNMIFVYRGGHFVYVNKRCEDALGYKQEELLSPAFDFLSIVAPKSKEIIISNYKKHMAGQQLAYDEYSILDKEKHSMEVIGTTKLIDYKGEKAIFGILTDITEHKRAEEERKRLEAQLYQAQRMEAIGTLAGGIAHNFNNLLMGIQGNASLASWDLDPKHPNQQRLENIEKLVQSGSNLTNQLLGYARESSSEVRPVNLNHLIKAAANAFATARKEIRVHQDLAEDLFRVAADPGQIDQVLMNLFVNAADAMPRGGDLFLKAMNMRYEDIQLLADQPGPGNYVLLGIRDTGVGMDNKTMSRIFDPFFTTKGLVKGTGLGLAFVYGIIKNHNGFIQVKSEQGQGTTFEIYLPALEEKSFAEKDFYRELIKGKETVLLVDDEDIVMDVGAEFLKKMGYKVLSARSGSEALDIYRCNSDKVDIVILDMIMPGMGGGETFDHLMELNPDIRVLLSSGYSIDGQAAEILARGCQGFIHKPFNMSELSRKIREILDH
jgi:two-component system, cell cycle sensor histidine kinase and response regulator CckA